MKRRACRRHGAVHRESCDGCRIANLFDTVKVLTGAARALSQYPSPEAIPAAVWAELQGAVLRGRDVLGELPPRG